MLTNILNLAGLITVPLLNWSWTLRELGSHFSTDRKPDGFEEQKDAGTRSIVIWWAFLVLIGNISLYSFILRAAPVSNTSLSRDLLAKFEGSCSAE